MNVIVNGVEENLNPPLTVSGYLKQKAINSKTVVIEFNGKIIKNEEYVSQKLNNNDVLEILRILGGG